MLGAFVAMVENANEPSKSEFSRAITDERLGIPLEEAIRKVSVRMASRDLEQVAMLAELLRTTGGNAAEVLDVIVLTVRERHDIRRLVRTLTTQGRMARWILTALPIATGLAFWALQPDIVGPMWQQHRRPVLPAGRGDHGRHRLVRHPENHRDRDLGGHDTLLLLLAVALIGIALTLALRAALGGVGRKQRGARAGRRRTGSARRRRPVASRTPSRRARSRPRSASD